MKIKTIFKVFMFFVFTILLSCSDDSSEIEVVEEYDINEVSALSMSFERGLRNQEVVFSLLGSNDVEYTEFATFFINGIAIEGNKFSSSTEGDYNVYAEYDLAGTMTTTSTASIEIFIPKRKVLFEDYTGTWCGYCTAMLGRIDEMESITDDISVVSIHVGNDPFAFPDAQVLIDHFEVIFIPTGYQDRQYFYGDAWPAEFVTDYASLEVPVTISLASSIVGNELSVNVDILSEENMAGYNIAVFLLEDGLIANQANTSNTDVDSPYYQLGNPIPNFVHNDVLRASLTDVFGDPINETEAFTEFNKTITYLVPSEYNLDNLSLVAFVTDANGVAINSQSAHVGEEKGYE